MESSAPSLATASKSFSTCLQELLALPETVDITEEPIPPMVLEMVASADWSFNADDLWDANEDLVEACPSVPSRTRSLPIPTNDAKWDRRLSTGGSALAQPTALESAQETNVYVSNLPRSITEAQFRGLCLEHGEVFSTKLMHREAPMPTIGFAQYLKPEMAQAATEKLNGMVFQGRHLKVRLAHRNKDKGISNRPSANLYVANLPKHFTEAEMRELFEPFGEVISLIVLRNPSTGKSKGVGMVRFSSIAEARLAAETLHGTSMQRGLALEVKYAENVKERTLRLATRHRPEHDPEVVSLYQALGEKPTTTAPQPPPVSRHPLPEVPEDMKDLSPEEIYSALAQYATVVLPTPLPKLELPPAVALDMGLDIGSILSGDSSPESTSETCGHSTSSCGSSSSGGDSPVAAPVKRLVKASKLRVDAQPFVPQVCASATAMVGKELRPDASKEQLAPDAPLQQPDAVACTGPSAMRCGAPCRPFVCAFFRPQ